MKIVVLDGYTLNPGDLTWDNLRALGDCTIYDRTPKEEVVARAIDAEILLTNKTVVDRAAILALPKLRYIGVLATGYNIVDAATAKERGIPVSNVPDYSTRSVAQLAMALLLELVHRTGHHAQSVSDGRWVRSADFCYWDYPLIELEGMTFGVLGLGRIGLATAELARAFGMKVIGYTRSGKTGQEWIEPVGLDDLFKRSDVLSLHCPLTEQTRGVVDCGRLALMKRTAFLLNTSRGPLIDEAALAKALNEGRIAGAGLDVLSVEPPKADNPLLTAKNCLITPHIAWATQAARMRLMRTVLDNISAFLSGQPRNVVNGV